VKSILGNLDRYLFIEVKYDFVRNVLVIPVAAMIMGILTGIWESAISVRDLFKIALPAKSYSSSIAYLIILTVFLILFSFNNTVFTHDEQFFIS